MGICCICGKYEKLSFEHIPPQCAFNNRAVRQYDFIDYVCNNNTRYNQSQQGAGGNTLCIPCNSFTGAKYGKAYAAFAEQGLSYQQNQAKGFVSVPYTIYPLRVLKQIVSCFASVNGPEWCERNPQIRKFLLDPYERKFPNHIDIRMYMQEVGRSKSTGLHGMVNVHTHEHFFGSEWGFFPFSFICFDKRMSDFKTLKELFPVLDFLRFDYDEETKVYLDIPRKPCNVCVLDFREGIPDLGTIIDNDIFRTRIADDTSAGVAEHGERKSKRGANPQEAHDKG